VEFAAPSSVTQIRLSSSGHGDRWDTSGSLAGVAHVVMKFRHRTAVAVLCGTFLSAVAPFSLAAATSVTLRKQLRSPTGPRH
jgi:hypothetical protein